MSSDTETGTESVPVLIVGGSLVGLTTALCLAAQGIKATLIERHSGSMAHPRALGFTPRTMEIFRALGFQHRIKEADPDFQLLRARVDSLAGKWHEQTSWTESKKDEPKVNPLQYSVSAGAAIPQDELEAVLVDEARQRGVDLRYNTTLVAFTQDADGVTATIESKDGEGKKSETTICAAYMVAADGNRSFVRRELGIKREDEEQGGGKMGSITSVMFRADLDKYLKSGVSQFDIVQADLKAFMTHYLDGRWALMFRDGQDRTREELQAAIRKAIGRKEDDGVQFEILTTGRWEITMLVSDKFQSGRVFLAGDAAHALPPNRGGFGANTGIGDAWNLAWKLAVVLSGISKPTLLETYEAERRPIALLRKQQISVRGDYKVHLKDNAATGKAIDDVAMELGELYQSPAISLNTNEELPTAQRPDEWQGQPGTRAAHSWMMTSEGKRKSTLDLFGRDWVLVSENKAWKAVAEEVSSKTAVKIVNVHVSEDAQAENLEEFRKIMGITSEGASLVRPDGIIAWRSRDFPDNAGSVLLRVIQQVAFSQ